MFDSLVADTTHHRTGGGAVAAWARVESAASARRLAAMADLLEARRAGADSDNREQWYLDNWAAVAAEIGAAQNTTPDAAGAQLLIAHALRTRLPHVGAVFAQGLLTYATVSTIAYRTFAITDPTALAAVDAEIAAALRTWPPMSKRKLTVAIDAIVETHDPYAVRRSQVTARSRYLDVDADGNGCATLLGVLLATDAAALDTRLNALADTTCPADPRTKNQRRADAVGALLAGTDHLPCLCATQDCTATPPAPTPSTVVYVVVNDDTLDDTTPADASQDAALDGTTPDTSIDLIALRRDRDAHHAAQQQTAQRETAHQQAEAPTTSTTATGETPASSTEKHPWERSLQEMLTNDDPGQPAATRPGQIIGGPYLPGAITRRIALTATIRRVIHPRDTPPEPRYTPSAKLAAFVRCRDLTCRFPGCDVPATGCDLDHTIPHPTGPTQASNLKALCRRHHLLKTFWGGAGGWRDRQLPDGTVVWTGPDQSTYTTTPGSRLLFPALCHPTAPLDPAIHQAAAAARDATPTSTLPMPTRQHTRTHDRTQRIHHERTLNAPHVERWQRKATPTC
ncbi:HNH endonuclease signature motif containing protein [Mycolicibacterium sediminis]|uniref:HNH endonuclease n=2 Tax=Mycolicibacterium sediminis TaxID=1286180 RepID=A0A7I7QKF8_9MYCO|nr:HNH endonuclease signature motif containing protein [Mycolicibacterium sediminis]BBY26762.1 HNH endonuclease [Mycolicibacterium sediminis]